MTIWELQAEYNRQYTEHHKAVEAHYAKYADYKMPYNGPRIDYDGLGEKLVVAIQEQYGFNAAQAGYIYGKAYERGHSSFGDVFGYAADLAEFIQKFPK
jgi:hypothetical protein